MIYNYSVHRRAVSNETVPPIRGAADAASYLNRFCYGPDDDDPRERVFVIMLDRQNNPTGHHLASVGGENGTFLDVKYVVRAAILAGASKIVLSHSHPHGDAEPSRSDIENTQRLKRACDVFDIQVLDHVIMAGNKYYSFCEESTGKIR